MFYYPDHAYQTHQAVTNRIRCIDNAVHARNVVLTERLGISIQDLKDLMDDTWCDEHRESVARLLNIRCDRNDFIVQEQR